MNQQICSGNLRWAQAQGTNVPSRLHRCSLKIQNHFFVTVSTQLEMSAHPPPRLSDINREKSHRTNPELSVATLK